LGIVIFSIFIAGMWASLERPPMRTMGETRLWYSFFLPVAGLVTYIRWRFGWMLSFSTILSFIFICINILRPEIHNKALMPALQSPWFVPHVTVYMLAYALYGVATIYALLLLIKGNRMNMGRERTPLASCDNLIYTGSALLTIGMLMGAIWAKAAWGHYWSWDPKETWAAATWLIYLLYIHVRLHRPDKQKAALYMVIIAFLILQICWFGVNYLPSAQGNSIHIYG